MVRFFVSPGRLPGSGGLPSGAHFRQALKRTADFQALHHSSTVEQHDSQVTRSGWRPYRAANARGPVQ